MDAAGEPAFRRNPELEEVLDLLNRSLEPAEDYILDRLSIERRPLVFIVGCARSGSTLLFQWLAQTGVFAYPTNFLSRFYAAPCVGAYIQQMLFEPAFQFRDELLLAPALGSFTSALGKTAGALSPHEFWYFWRHRMPQFGDKTPVIDEDTVIDFERIERDLAGLATIFQKPFVAKGHLLNWMIAPLAKHLKEAYFIFLRRIPLFTAQSLLEARVAYHGTTQKWYPVEPPEYEVLCRLRPEEQVAGQVYYTEKAVAEGLASMDPDRWIAVAYEDFCANPPQVWTQIAAMLAAHPGWPQPEIAVTAPASFESANQKRLPADVLDTISAAYQSFSTP